MKKQNLNIKNILSDKEFAAAYEEMIALTKRLVNTPSVNGTAGEKQIALVILDYLNSIPYFQNHPQNIIVQPLKNDTLGRLNIFALIEGEADKACCDTVILHGHIDTVGVDDFGAFAELAFDCDKLAKRLKTAVMPEAARVDFETGEYLFGRGSCDMKSGDAVFLVLSRYLTARVDEMRGNLLLSFNPVEETLHQGIIEGVEVISRLKKERGLNYIFAVNNDFICPMYAGDTTRYVYTGAVGKLLPSFYIMGQETHVAQCFEGFNTALAAAFLEKELDLNPLYCDGYEGEYSLPPTALKIMDLKPSYNVQTPNSALLYFNYFVHAKQLSEITPLLKKAAETALDKTLVLANERYVEYCRASGMKYKHLDVKTQVLEYKELYAAAKLRSDEDIDSAIDRITIDEKQKGTDLRLISSKIVAYLCVQAEIRIPTIVVYYSTPYCPHNTLMEEKPHEKRLIDGLEEILSEMEGETGENYKFMKFFPSLTDSSYLKIDDDAASVKELVENFPKMDELYPLPLEEMKGLDIPALNFGCWGKDAHKWTERVHVPYSFGILPKLIVKTLGKYIF